MAGQVLACPTADDVAQGVRVEFTNKGYSIFTRDTSGAVKEVEYTSPTENHAFLSENGVLETGYIDLTDGRENSFTYSFDTSALLPLEPWSGQAGEQTMTDANGAVTSVGFSYHTLGKGTYKIGACTYDAIKVLTYYRSPDETTMVELTYLTSLGIALNTAYGFFGSVEIYRATAISAE